MEKDKVPQDDENVFQGYSKVVYATDKNGTYLKVPTKGWEPENIALKQVWESIEENVANAFTLVNEGKASPILFHMQKNIMDLKLLSDYTGFSQTSIKKHLDPQEFKMLGQETLSVYAEVFKISVSQLSELK